MNTVSQSRLHPCLYTYFFLTLKSPVRRGARKPRRKRTPLSGRRRGDERRREEERGATRSSVSASVITGPPPNNGPCVRAQTCVYVCASSPIRRPYSPSPLCFSSSPLSSHAPLLLLRPPSSSVLFVCGARGPLPR